MSFKSAVRNLFVSSDSDETDVGTDFSYNDELSDFDEDSDDDSDVYVETEDDGGTDVEREKHTGYAGKSENEYAETAEKRRQDKKIERQRSAEERRKRYESERESRIGEQRRQQMKNVDNSRDFQRRTNTRNQSEPKVIRYAPKENEGENMNIIIFRPKVFSDIKSPCEQLRSGNTVIIDFGLTSEDKKTRMIDYISGVIFAIRGHVIEISQEVYIFSPRDVNISGDIANNQRIYDDIAI